MEHKLFLFLAIFITLFIGWGSLITISNIIPSDVGVSDKLMHVIAYLLLTLCWLLAYRNKYKLLKVNVYIVFFIFLYGIIIEVLQATITTNRQFEINDILANMLGISIGFTVFKVLTQKKLLK